MINSIFTKELEQINKSEILLDFFNKENESKIIENLILSISIENTSDNLKNLYRNNYSFMYFSFINNNYGYYIFYI